MVCFDRTFLTRICSALALTLPLPLLRPPIPSASRTPDEVAELLRVTKAWVYAETPHGAIEVGEGGQHTNWRVPRESSFRADKSDALTASDRKNGNYDSLQRGIAIQRRDMLERGYDPNNRYAFVVGDYRRFRLNRYERSISVCIGARVLIL